MGLLRPMLIILILAGAVISRGLSARAGETSSSQHQPPYYQPAPSGPDAADPPAENQTLLVSTLDGRLHALSLSDGSRLWSLKSSPLISSSLDHSQAPDGGGRMVDSIIAGIDGSLYYSGDKGLARWPVNIRDIAHSAPLKSRGTRYVASKTSRVLLVSKRSGRVIQVMDSSKDVGECELDQKEDDIVWVGKTEFKVQAVDSADGRRRWNISFGEFSPFFDDTDSSGKPRQRASDAWLGESAPFIGASVNGYLYCKHTNGNWSLNLGSPVAAVHLIGKGSDILRIPHTYLEHRYLGAAGRKTLGAAGLNKLGSGGGSDHEVVFLGRNDDGQLFAIGNPDGANASPASTHTLHPAGAGADGIYPAIGTPFLDSDREQKAVRMLRSDALVSIRLPGVDVVPARALPAPASNDDDKVGQGSDDGGLRMKVTLREGSDEEGDEAVSIVCTPDQSDYPACLSGFHLLPPMDTLDRLGHRSDDLVSRGTSPHYLPLLPAPVRPGGGSAAGVTGNSIRRMPAVYEAGWVAWGAFFGYLVAVGATEAQATALVGSVVAAVAAVLAYAAVRVAGACTDRTASGDTDTGDYDEEERVEESKRSISTVKRIARKNQIRLGRMRVYCSQVLGRGSSGTVVFNGSWDRRECAVKRILKAPCDAKAGAAGGAAEQMSVEKEIQLLISSDHLPNIVRYFAKEEDQTFVYLALEKCPKTLFERVHEKNFTNAVALETARGVIAGVRQLHSLDVVHRDLKPRNILIASDGRAKIADMGLGKKLSKHRSSFDSRVCGSVGWQPCEVIRPAERGGRASVRLTKAVDVFSAGCIVYYTLTRGKHPFGTEPEREYKIVHDKPDLSALNGDPLAADLVRSMIGRRFAQRVTASDAGSHPLFWDAATQLGFLQDVSDRAALADGEASRLCALLESRAVDVVGSRWDKRLDAPVIDGIGKFRKYRYGSVCDCLRVLRNKRHHFLDLPRKARRLLGPLPDGFVRYFSSRFPLLLLHSYKSIGSFYASGAASDAKRRQAVDKCGAGASAHRVDFETFRRYYEGLSAKRVEQFRGEVTMPAARGWWTGAGKWASAVSVDLSTAETK